MFPPRRGRGQFKRHAVSDRSDAFDEDPVRRAANRALHVYLDPSWLHLIVKYVLEHRVQVVCLYPGIEHPFECRLGSAWGNLAEKILADDSCRIASGDGPLSRVVF